MFKILICKCENIKSPKILISVLIIFPRMYIFILFIPVYKKLKTDLLIKFFEIFSRDYFLIVDNNIIGICEVGGKISSVLINSMKT